MSTPLLVSLKVTNVISARNLKRLWSGQFVLPDPSTVRSVFCRVTAQRSQEDAEEVERERRRRSREKERGDRSPSCSEGPLQDELAYNTESVFVHVTVVLQLPVL